MEKQFNKVNVISRQMKRKHKIPLLLYGGWFRHYATNLKIAGSIPDEVTGFSN
jgi:hypothetical protein